MSKKLVLISVVFLNAFAASAMEPQRPQSQRIFALVYQGPGSCAGEDDCSGAAAEIAREAGLPFKFVTPETLTPSILQDAAVWIQPGGNAITAAQTLGPEKLELIRDFVRRGGGYVGFCAGAFLSDRTVDNEETIGGLGIIPMSTADYILDNPGQDGTIVPIRWKGSSREVFFNGGGYFDMPSPDPRVHVTSRYTTGEVASIETRYGEGNIAVSGFHPEATNEWKRYATGTDHDGSDLDITQSMVAWALKRSDARMR